MYYKLHVNLFDRLTSFNIMFK